MDYDLTRAYDLLDKGQENRAQALFKTYLHDHPNNQWARDGYVKSGGKLADLGLEAPKSAAPKPVVESRTEEDPAAPAEDNAPQEDESPVAEAAAPAGVDNAPVKADDAQMEIVDPAAPKPRSARLQAMIDRVKHTGFLFMAAGGVLLAVGLAILLAWLGIRFARWHEARNLARLRELAAAGGVSAYVALRHWTAWWGLGVDADLAAKRALDLFHAEGWTCVEAQRDSWLFPSIPSPQRGLTVLLSLLTGGFLHYYIGPNFLLSREPGAVRTPAPPPPAETETA
jgi:hypothetical protein